MQAKKLYVIEQYIACNPKLTTWTLLEERDKVYIVDLRGTKKVLRKDAAGRRYYTSEKDALDYLHNIFLHEYRRAKHDMNRWAYLSGAPDKTVLDYVRGVESVVDDVENITREM